MKPVLQSLFPGSTRSNGSFSLKSIGRLSAMMPNHQNADTPQPFFKGNVVGKLVQIGPSQARGVVMMPLRKLRNLVNRFVKLAPKSFHQTFRNRSIPRRNSPRVLGCFQMEDQIHRWRLPSAGLAKFRQAQPLHLSGLQLITPLQDFLVIYPMMGFLETAQEKSREFRSLQRRQA
jgi:hypothetical protein